MATESKNLEVMRKFSEQYAKRCSLLCLCCGKDQHQPPDSRMSSSPPNQALHACTSRDRASSLSCTRHPCTQLLFPVVCSDAHACCICVCFRSGTYFCVDKSVTAVVIQGLAEHKDTLGAPLCPCRHYDDKEAEAQMGFWNCPCVPMRERKVGAFNSGGCCSRRA